MMRTAIALLGMLSACDPSGDAIPSAGPTRTAARSFSPSTETIALPAFEGRWTVVAFDGRPPVAPREGGGNRTPSLTFSRTGYGGNAGCNALGGIGTLNGDRFYTLPGPQTVMACSGPLLAQETMFDKVMRASPVVKVAPDGRMTLTGGGHALALERDGRGVAPPVEPPPLLVGARFSIHTVDGVYLTPRSPRGDSRPLAFDAAEWRATPVCATVSGRWSQDGWTLRAGDVSTTGANCTGGAAVDAAIRAVFASNPGFSLGPNGEFLLAGNGHWIAGARDAIATQRETPALGGSWDVVEIDQRPPVASGGSEPRRPAIEFGATVYGGTTGCNSIQGSFISREGRLYTNPGPTTQMGCGALAAQEKRIYELLRNAPRIARAGAEIRLIDERGSMSLRRSDRRVTAYARAGALPSRYAGVALTINGQPAELRVGDPKSRVTMSGSDVRFDIGCGIVSTFLRRDRTGMSLISKPKTSDGERCKGDKLAQHRLLMRLSNGPVSGIVDGNGDLLLAGGGAWLTARTD